MSQEHAPAPEVTLAVNGSARSVPGEATLLSALREALGLTGAKPGCLEGACGACTVLVNGEPLRSCQVTAASVAGAQVTTVEGLAGGGPPGAAGLHPVQQAFAREGAAQCGYCTPGMVLAAVALLARDRDPPDTRIDAALAGHICRCGAYPRIRRAVRRAAALAGGRSQAGDVTAPGTGRASPDPAGAAEAGRWSPPRPGEAAHRPARPWDLTSPAERDWFGILGDGLVVVIPPPDPSAGWSTAAGAWLHVSPAGQVTAFTGKVDVGQDNTTALRMLVAEEMRVPLPAVLLAMGDTDLCPHDMGTYGSRSMPDAGMALRRAAAAARSLLPVLPGQRRVEVVADGPALTDPRSWRVAGHPQLPSGIAAAVTGARLFASDLALPGVLHGAMLRPPVPGARLRALSLPAHLRAPDAARSGRARLVRAGQFTGVVAADEAAARRAVAELAAGAEWDLPDLPSDSAIAGYLRAHPARGGRRGWGGPFTRLQGSPAAALETAQRRLEATYTTAYIAPAPLETRVAIAAWGEDGRLTVWTGTQTPFPVRAQVAAALGVPEHDVRVIVPPTGGAFGGKHAGGVATEAAILAREAGAPVRVAWSRAEEFTAGTLRPAAVIDVAAGLAADGRLSGWTFRNINSGAAAIATPYAVADQLLEYVPAASPLPQASYRALAATANNFARESAIDELAGLAGADPVEFRLRNLADERLAAVLRALAEHVGWEPGQAVAGGAGVGIACGLEKDARVATAAQVAVRNGLVRVTGLVTAYECGAVVNPLTVRNQVEGAVVMALGGAMYEAIEFTGGAITNGSFSSYRVPRFGDVPPVEVILLDRPDLPSAGAGETPMIAVAPAIAAAIASATGRRLRSLPLTRDGRLPG